MNILIPMAGEGKRFADRGYSVSKPCIPTYDRKDGKKKPMVVCATLDLPGVEENGANVIYVNRDFHKKDGTENLIHKYFKDATFITSDHLTEGQACTCMLAENRIDNEEELLIAGCDNGMEFDLNRFDEMRKDMDCIVFTYRHNESVLLNPNSIGWMKVDERGNILDTSIKKAISDTPMEDHAVVATFWFRKGTIFVKATQDMLEKNDRINGEFYVDQVIKYVLNRGYKAKVLEIDRYIGWGTPNDYELYQNTFEYWRDFYLKDGKKRIG